MTLEYAQGVAEDLARREGQRSFIDPAAAWRRQPASTKQLETLAAWGVPFDMAITRGEASDLMTAQLAKWTRR